jgi:glucosamine-6-phosphate deaminase
MRVQTYSNVIEMGKAAADTGAAAIKDALAKRGWANIILATGTSQYQTLKALAGHTEIPWEKVYMFHLDEYIGLSADHPASFRKYLTERFVEKVGTLAAFNPVQGDAPSPEEECRRLGRLIGKHPVDVAFIGIGENAHIAFNDPPADFETDVPYLIVNLDRACRMQQVNEGWYDTLKEVPAKAISMGIRQILKSRKIIVSIPDARKADAVNNMISKPITPDVPATILRTHPDCRVYLDTYAAQFVSDGNF